MPLVVVTCKVLAFVGKKHPQPAHYPKDSVLDVTDEEAAGLFKDKNAALAPAGASVSAGLPIAVDPVEKDVQEKNFEAAKGGIKKPEGAEVETLKTPIPGTSEGIGMARRAASVDAQPISR